MFLVSDILDSYFRIRLKSSAYRKKVFQLALDKKLRDSRTGMVLVRNINQTMTGNKHYQDEFISLSNGKDYQKSFWESDLGYGWYFWNPPSENKYFQMVVAEMKARNYTSLLDVGCGWGGLAAMAAGIPSVNKVWGIDISEDIVAAPKNIYPDSKAKFFCLDVRQVNEKFDLVTLMGSTDYIPPAVFEDVLKHVLTITNKEIMIVNSLRKIDFDEAQQFTEAKEVRRFDVGYVHPLKSLLKTLQASHKFSFEINPAGENSMLARILVEQ